MKRLIELYDDKNGIYYSTTDVLNEFVREEFNKDRVYVLAEVEE